MQISAKLKVIKAYFASFVIFSTTTFRGFKNTSQNFYHYFKPLFLNKNFALLLVRFKILNGLMKLTIKQCAKLNHNRLESLLAN